jgi:hypothetical protein
MRLEGGACSPRGWPAAGPQDAPINLVPRAREERRRQKIPHLVCSSGGSPDVIRHHASTSLQRAWRITTQCCVLSTRSTTPSAGCRIGGLQLILARSASGLGPMSECRVYPSRASVRTRVSFAARRCRAMGPIAASDDPQPLSNGTRRRRLLQSFERRPLGVGTPSFWVPPTDLERDLGRRRQPAVRVILDRHCCPAFPVFIRFAFPATPIMAISCTIQDQLIGLAPNRS